MKDIGELAERIIKYEADLDWYGLVDDYGNIETDEDARKNLKEITIALLKISPNDILNSLQENLEEMDEDNELYQETKDLIKELEDLKELQEENDMEM